jgi:hypothetical protein
VTLKNEAQFQMYLDVLDILQKNNFSTKQEKDGLGRKISVVLKNEKICGKVFVVSTPTAKRESALYAVSAHAKLVAAKEEARSVAEKNRISGEGAFVNFKEGEWTGTDGCLYYFGHSGADEDSHEWVEIVDKNFQRWREKSPLYFSSLGEMEKFKKKKASSAEEFHALEKEFKRLADGFSGISDYRNSAELSAECAKFVAGEKEKILDRANKKFEKLNKSKGTTSKHFREMVNDYTELSQKFTMIVPFLDAAEKVVLCQKKIEEHKIEETKAIFSESVERMRELQKIERKMAHTPPELSKIIADYEELLTRFMSIEKHDGVAEKIAFCAGEIAKLKAYHTSATYKEALKEFEELEERPETEKLFEFIRRARRYKKISKKFHSTLPYDDSIAMEKKSRKLYKSFRWKITKKIFPFAIIFAAVIAIAIFIFFTFIHDKEGGNNDAISATFTGVHTVAARNC